MTRFLFFPEKLFHIKGALHLKDLVPYLTVFFGMWSCSSLLVLHRLTDTFFWKKNHLIVLEDCHC